MARNYEAELLGILPQMGWEGGKALPALLVGVPGIAKTQIIEGLVKAYDAALRSRKLLEEDEEYALSTFVLPQTSPDALEGVGVPSKDFTELNRLPLAIVRRLRDAKYGLLFGDELSSGTDETGASFMTFAQDGRAGDVQIPDTVGRVFAMNPSYCAAAGRELSPPEANRFCWIMWKLDVDDWVDYMRGGSGVLRHVRILPQNWEDDYGLASRVLVASFVQSHQHLFNDLEMDVAKESMTSSVDKREENNMTENGAWASPRSWFNFARVMAAVRSLGEDMDSPLLYIAARGLVGESAGQAFMAWLKGQNLPDVEELLAMEPAEATAIIAALRPDEQRVTSEQLAFAQRKSNFSVDERVKRWETAAEILLPIFKTAPDAVHAACKIVVTHVPRGGYRVIDHDHLRGIVEKFKEMGVLPEHRD